MPDHATVTLRPVTDGDRGLLFRLFAHTREAELSLVPWPADTKHAFLEQQFAAQDAAYRAYPSAQLDVVEVDGEPVGRLYLHRMPTEIGVIDVVLLPEWQGRGIGTFLLSNVLDEARRRADGRRVTLHVEHGNPAFDLYARLGFVVAEEGDIYRQMVWEPEVARVR